MQTATLDGRALDLSLEAHTQITPATQGAPVSGEVEFAYRQRDRRIEFGDSRLELPNSESRLPARSGGEIKLAINSTNLEDMKPALTLEPRAVPASLLPILGENGTAHFDGTLRGSQLAGRIALSHFQFQGRQWDDFHSNFQAAPEAIEIASFDLRKVAHARDRQRECGAPRLGVGRRRGYPSGRAFQDVDVATAAASGLASGSIKLGGSLDRPNGNAHLDIQNAEGYGERFDRIRFDAALQGNRLHVANGQARQATGAYDFSGDYEHSPGGWLAGQLNAKVDSNISR